MNAAHRASQFTAFAATVATAVTVASLSSPAFAQSETPVATQSTTTTIESTSQTTTYSSDPAIAEMQRRSEERRVSRTQTVTGVGTAWPGTGTASSAVVATRQLSPGVGEDRAKSGFGPEFGVYLPVNNRVRDTFGTAWFSLGFGIGRIQRPDPRGQFQADIRLFGVSRSSGREVIMAPINFNYRRALSTNYRTAPYVGAGLSLVGSQLRSDQAGVASRFRGTYGVNLFGGVQYTDRAYIQARYFALAPTRGYDISGVNLALGLRF